MKYTIPVYKLKTILNKLEELNHRIVGMEGRRIEWAVTPAYEKTIYTEENNIKTNYNVEVVDIDVTNPVVSLNGWSFLAIIEHSRVGNIVMKKLYDVPIPEQYFTSDTYCEHCNTNRYRKFTYLVYKAETKEIHQVGSTCLTAYLGFDASLLMAHATLFTRMNDMMDTEHNRLIKRGVETQPLHEFLKQTIAWIEKFGYVSAAKARNDAQQHGLDENHIYLTATGVDVWYLKYEIEKRKLFEDGEFTSDATNSTYNQIIEWVKGMGATSDYIRNIKILVDREYVTYKTATTAASIVGVYLANLNKHKVENTKVSNYFGTVGNRIDVDMVLTRKTKFEGNYGVSTCYMFETIDGNVAVWFTAAASLDVGTRYVGKATIAKHTDFKGLKQTQINRCNLKPVLD